MENRTEENRERFRRNLETAMKHPSIRSEQAVRQFVRVSALAARKKEGGDAALVAVKKEGWLARRRERKKRTAAPPKLTPRSLTWILLRYVFGSKHMSRTAAGWKWKSPRTRLTTESRWDLLRRINGKD